MSAVNILTPLVAMTWPAFSAAAAAAADRLGYEVGAVANRGQPWKRAGGRTGLAPVQGEGGGTGDRTGREARVWLTREGVTVTFSRDTRGRASLCVSGDGHTEEVLRALGEELSRAVVQQYVYRKLMEGMTARGFKVVADQANGDRSIRLRIRRRSGI